MDGAESKVKTIFTKKIEFLLYRKCLIDDDELMMMNCFCGMVDRRKAFNLISSRDHCQRSSPSRISGTPQAGFEPVQNLSSSLAEWSCAVVITTTNHYTCRHTLFQHWYVVGHRWNVVCLRGHLEPCQTPITEPFLRKSKGLKF